MPGLLEDLLCSPHKGRKDSFALAAQPANVIGARGVAHLVSQLDQPVESLRLLPGKLIDGPRGKRRFSQRFDALTAIRIPCGLEFGGQLVARTREFVERQGVEILDIAHDAVSITG